MATASSAWTGTNTIGNGDPIDDLRQRVDAAHGSGAFDAALVRALAIWQAATNVTFVEASVSAGAFATETAPDIRIGAYNFDDDSGGAGFGPQGNDLTHLDAVESCMCGFIPGSSFDPSTCVGEVIRRELTADDQTGIDVLYGVVAAPVSGLTRHGDLMAAALLLFAIRRGRAWHSMLPGAS